MQINKFAIGRERALCGSEKCKTKLYRTIGICTLEGLFCHIEKCTLYKPKKTTIRTTLELCLELYAQFTQLKLVHFLTDHFEAIWLRLIRDLESPVYGTLDQQEKLFPNRYTFYKIEILFYCKYGNR